MLFRSDFVRRAVQDGKGKEFACDFQIDKQLQRAILELAEEAKIDVKGVPEYKILSRAEKNDK